MSKTQVYKKKSTGTDSLSIDDSSTQKLPDVKKKENKKKTPSVSILKLFRFATRKERYMIIIAIIFSAIAGILHPVSLLIYGSTIFRVTNSLGDTSTATMLASYIGTCLWILTGESQARRIRSLYLHSILKQDMGWFDRSVGESLNTRLASDTQLIQDGISEKFGICVTLVSQFISGLTVAFVKGYKMALIMAAAVPLLVLTTRTMAFFVSKYVIASQKSYAKAGSIAEQTFQSIRTVYSFTLQKRFLEKYEVKLEEAFGFGIKRGFALGLGFATFYLILFSNFAVALWFGSSLVMKGELHGSIVFVVFLAMLSGSLAFLKLPYSLSAIYSARGAAFKIFEIIDQVPEIDSDSNEGITPASIEGAIEFKNVNFKYPTRPDVDVLKGLNLKIELGRTVAIVGSSGSGKSTVIQLVQRFYDTLSGQVIVDDNDVKKLNVKWLRQQIGVVSQEPVLFNMTIRQNLLMGTHEDIPEKTIFGACKEANCHSFIMQLPEGYDTLVGEQGSMLSGGQKQRIAIARAILKNPRILLLDEATSALDTQSERLVQNALDKASANRTTIVVAHRLSTIMNADLIVVLDHGIIIEQGTHQTLIELNGTYADLVKKQAVDINQAGVPDMAKSSFYDAENLLRQEQLELKQQIIDCEKRSLSNASSILSPDNVVEDINNKIDARKVVAVTTDAYDIKIAEQKKIKENARQQRAPVWRILKNMRQEWGYIGIGIIGSMITGVVFPVYALCFSRIVVMLNVSGQDIQPSPLGGTNLFAFLFVIIGIGAFIGNFAQYTAFETCGEKFTKRLRKKVFAAYMKQEVGFFDLEENNTGALTSRLAIDARNVNEIITKVWGDVASLFTTIISSFAIAFSHSWAITLIVLCIAPFVAASTAYEFRLRMGFEDATKKANAQCGQVAGEAIREVRTVVALNKQAYFEERYHHATDHPHKLAKKKAFLSSIAGGFGKGIVIYSTALGFYAGIHLIMNGSITFQQMFTSVLVITVASEASGRSTTFADSFSKAKYAAIATYEVIERKSKIDPELEGVEPNIGSLAGDVAFENIKFTYPARSDVIVFNGKFNLSALAGQSTALVGPSGSGKSTTIAMLQRWYDPLNGVASLDQKNVSSYSVYNLRSHMALVGQEPVLFDMTIGENIRFGADDHTYISQQDVEDACKAANIHTFISSLPQGYDTRVGDKGSQLSGGQKQRIAIARALIRKPKVLLLDEATSALDSESERIVQEALDNILQEGGRTTITIAHRLSTIKNVDTICVIKDGRVIEQGTHWELLKLNGTYTELAQQQSLNIL